MNDDPITYNGFDIRTHSFAIDESDNFYTAYNISKQVGADTLDEGLLYLRVDGITCEYSSESEDNKAALNAAMHIIDKQNE